MNQEVIVSTFLEKSALGGNTTTSGSEQRVTEPLVEMTQLVTMPVT
jgi:hypothetical protein